MPRLMAPRELVNHLMDVYFPCNTPVYDPENGNAYFRRFQYAQRETPWVAVAKMKWTIGMFSTHKSVGLSGFTLQIF